MTLQKAIEILEYHNKWRRSKAIDMVVEHHKNSNLTIEGNKLILTKHATE